MHRKERSIRKQQSTYNPNSDENRSLLESCKPLADYTEVVRRINEKWRTGMTKEDARRAVDEAIRSCIRDGILVAFLTKHRSEAIDMFLTEFNEKVYAESMFEDGRQAGIEEGEKAGIEKGFELVASEMLKAGKSPQEIYELCQIPLDLIERVQKAIPQK